MTFPAAVRRAAALLASALLLLAPALAFAGAAGAQARRPSAPDVDADGPQRGPLIGLDVTRIDGTALPGAGLRLVAAVKNDTPERREGLTLTASVHPRVSSRYEYQRALDDGALGAALARWSVDVDPVPPDATSEVPFRRTEQELAQVRVHGPGVYPVELAIIEDGITLDALTTAIVLTPEEVDQPLRISIVAPLELPPPDGEALLDPEGAAALAAQATGLDRGVPVTVAVDGLLLDEAARLGEQGPPGGGGPAPDTGGGPAPDTDGDGLLHAVEQLAAGNGVEVVTRPYAGADLTALVRGGMRDVAVDAVRHSHAAISRHAGIEPDDRVLWPPAGLDFATLERLAGEGVRTVVLAEEFLSIPALRDLPTSPEPVRSLTAGGVPVDAVVPDPWLSASLQAERRRGGALAVQRLVAETAVVFFERPFAAEPRGIVVAGQQGTASDRHTPALLERLAATPWLAPVTASQLVADIPPDDRPAQLAAPGAHRSDELDPSYVASLGRALDRLDGLASSIEGEDGAFAELSGDLRLAASVWYRDPARTADGQARIRAVEEAVGAVERAVTVADLPVTLASVEGQLPVTLHSDAPMPLRVRVSAASQRYEFVGGPDQEVVLEPERATTVLFGVRARAPGGTHPVRVTVTDDGGALVLAQGTVVVRSTAVSVVALVITIGAALFLAVWWLRDARRRRAARDASAESSVAAVAGGRR